MTKNAFFPYQNRVACSSHVVDVEEPLGPPEDGVLGGVVRVVLGRDLQDGGHGRRVLVDRVPDHISDLKHI